MMTITDIRTIIDQITYKPDCKITVHESTIYPEGEGVEIRINAFQVRDTDDPEGERTCSLIFQRDFSTKYHFHSEFYVLLEIKQLLYDFESHELREWFKYKGVKVDNPHQKENTL